MNMTEDEMRDFTILVLNPRTERDAQVEVGASNLSNPCDRCRAHEILGHERGSAILDAAWGGRVVGTAIHKHIEGNLKIAAATASETGDDLAQLGFRYPGIETELHMTLGELTPGRIVTSSTDIYLPSKKTVVDVKNTTLRAALFIRDALGMLRGNGPIFGRDHDFALVYTEKEPGLFRKVVKGVSERVYADEIEHAKYKLTRYSNQLHLYGMGLVNMGKEVDQAFLNFVCRDSAMTVDNRESGRYMEEGAPRGVFSVGFTYNHEYAVGYWKNAQAMAAALDAGTKTPTDYMAHPLCLVCTDEAKREERATVTIEAPVGNIDPWAALTAA